MKNALLGFVLLITSTFAFGQNIPEPGSYVPGELLIKVDHPESVAGIINSMQIVNNSITGFRIEREISKPVNIWLVSFNENVLTNDEMIAALYTNKHILIAQNNHYIQERVTVPNDPSFSSQWHHIDGTDNDIDSDLAWDITTGGTTPNGDQIVVCVIEGGGADWSHPDLVANHWVNTAEIANNLIDDDGNGYVDDYDGWNTGNNTDNIATGSHGTQVSGMIGAVGNNSNNVAGANWTVKIMQVDMASSLTESNVIAAYAYPLTMRQLYTTSGGTEGAFVVATNASWGIDNANPLSYPLWCDFYNTLGEAGILNCGATANNNVNIDVVGDMPTACSSPYMISVTATNSSDVRTFSGYGQTTIDLGSPGASVVTTSAGGGSGATSGTSFASPLTAGVIALIYSAPCVNLADFAMMDPQGAADLVRTALLDGTDPVANLTTECVTGGRLNSNNSLLLMIAECPSICTMTTTSSSTDATCNGGNDGSITVSPNGGLGTYTYDIGSGPQAGNTFAGLAAGSYTVIVSDGGACTETLNFSINSPTALSGSTVVTDASSGSNGSIDLTPSGGTPPYTYLWNGPSSFTASTQDISGLSAGVYDVTITDGNGCSFPISGLTVTTCDMITTTSSSDVLCFDDCNGEITITPTGGTGTYTFDIGSGAQAGNTFTGLCPGPYSVMVDDAGLCNQTFNFTINEPSTLSGSTSQTNELFGNDGSINLTTSGGTSGYTFSWTGPGGFTASTEDISGLTAGVYEVTITDANGCVLVVTNITITSSVGINENKIPYSIYPNPASKEFTIALPEGTQVEINLHDALGNIVMTQSANKTTIVNVSAFSKGIYIYTLVDQSGNIATGKLIIE